MSQRFLPSKKKLLRKIRRSKSGKLEVHALVVELVDTLS